MEPQFGYFVGDGVLSLTSPKIIPIYNTPTIFFRSILMLFTRLRVGLSKCVFSSLFLNKILYFVPLPAVPQTPIASLLFVHPNYIWCTVLIMQLLIMHICQLPSTFPSSYIKIFLLFFCGSPIN